MLLIKYAEQCWTSTVSGLRDNDEICKLWNRLGWGYVAPGYRIVHLSNALSLLAGSERLDHTCHILMVSSLGQTVNKFWPSGLKQLWITGATWAGSERSLLADGYSCTAIEFVRGVKIVFGDWVSRIGVLPELEVLSWGLDWNDGPCVLRSSLQCGDQCRE